MQRKYQQIKNYAKILKQKRGTGKIQQITLQNNTKIYQQVIEEQNDHVEMLKNQQFEDQFQDQYEQEDAWVSQPQEEDEEEVNQSGTMMSENKQKDIKGEQQIKNHNTVFLGSNKHLNKGQILEFDNKAYDMLHRLNVEWPSMSIDFIIKNSPFDSSPLKYQQMNKYPYEVFTVQGSCNNTNKNSVYFTKWAKLHQTKYDDDPQGNDQNDQNNDQDPEVIIQQIQTSFDVNRLRSLNNSPIVAFWNDDGFNHGQIRILDLSSNFQKLNNNIGTKKKDKCKQIIIPCDASGYAINWNPNKIGQLVAGDNNGVIRVYNNNQNYSKWSKTSQYTYHKGSVEDIMFSPEQSYVFASCSSDGTLQVVDMRTNQYKKSQLKINAHKKDVNVFDWNKAASHLIVTGSDDCKVKVWDLRMVSQNSDDQLLCFNWHTQPITSIKFQPNEQSVIAVSSEDNRLTIWDMSVQNQDQQDNDIPNEMMFLHQGQQEIKEISYHPIYYQMLISTSLDSINIFKPAFQMPEYCQDQKIDKQDLKRPPIREEDLDKYIQRMSLQ